MKPSGTTKQHDSLTHSPDKVDTTEAIRERLQLHPHADGQEIAGMLELDGVGVSAEDVERIRSELGSH
jgi:hypothetical protein